MAPAPIRDRNGSSEPIEKNEQQRNVIIQSPIRTPAQGRTKKPLIITEAQKQALIDNLQLEVTERARKLRAQYALQAQSLRARIELRINRIPTSMRKANIGELYEKYQEATKAAPQETTPSDSEAPRVSEEKDNQEKVKSPAKDARTTAPGNPKGTKRKSDKLDNADKENTPEPGQIPNPKKRTKTTTTKGPSRQVTNPSTILSPKSSNSRTLPQSPMRPINLPSPQKPLLGRPTSPLKPLSPSRQLSPAKSVAVAATATLANEKGPKPRGKVARGGGRKATNPTTMTRARRAAAAPPVTDTRIVSNGSEMSTTSNATTVVKRGGNKAPTAAQKRGGVRAAGKKAVNADAPPAAGRRVLRKRA